jgi:formate hydrogenlyase subunit 3/multisubunit Na+/H+ antiporter MnhD subunit
VNTIALLLFLPFSGAAIALVLKLVPAAASSRALRAAPLLPMVGMAAILVLTYPSIAEGPVLYRALGGWTMNIAIVLSLDGLGWLLSILVVGITFLAGIAALSFKEYGADFYFFLLMLVAGMETVVLTTDIFTMFVGFEIVAIAAYILIAFDRTDHGLLAAFKYLVLSSVGIIFFLLGVFVVYREFGTLSLIAVHDAITSGSEIVDPHSLAVAVVALVVGIGVRTAFIPFHTWLPEAHAYAPHPVSAILSGVLIKVSFFALVKIVEVFQAAYLMTPFMWIGGITAVAAVIWALSQHDAKRLLAYHSISQMGYVLAAFGALSSLSLSAAFLHAGNHALFKSLLFLAVGTAIYLTGERDLFRMPRIGRRAPVLSIALIIGAASIAGIPPFNGFVSKQVVTAALHGSGAPGAPIVEILLTITAIGTIASFMKVARIALPGRGSQKTGGASPLVVVPVVFLAILCVLTGVWGLDITRGIVRILGTGDVGAALDAVPSYSYSTEKILTTGLSVVAGSALYRLVLSERGRKVTDLIQSITPDLRTVLVMFILGLGVFFGFAIF